MYSTNCLQPYVAERSRSIYARLGARIAFFGIDARTEVSNHERILWTILTFDVAYTSSSKLSRNIQEDFRSS